MSANKILATIVVLPLVAYGGLKLWVRHNTQESLKYLEVAARPYASMQYRGISSTLWSGQVAVEGLRIRPHGFSDDIRIQAAELQAGDLGKLITASRALQQGEWPRTLGVALRGINVDVDGSMFDTLDRLQQVAASGPGLAHCGGVARIGATELRAMGYETLWMDVTLNYVIRRAPDQIRVSLDWQARDMAALRSEFTLNGAPGRWEQAPNLERVRLVYRDQSYSERLKKHCSRASGISEAAYIEAEANRPDAVFRAQWGFVPGTGLRAAYRRFLETPGEFVLEARPNGVDPRLLQFYKPRDVLAMLNVQASVNGSEITDLGFQREALPVPTASAALPASVQRAFTPPPDKPSTPVAVRRTGEYRAVRVSELSQHVGKPVRLSLARGVVREGTLTEALPNLVSVARSYGRGEMTFRVLTTQLEKVEVRD